MSTLKFNVKKWEADLPKGGGPELATAVYNPPLNMNSIHSRPFRYLLPSWGPGGVVRNSTGNVVGIRGSFEGPPFVGRTYDITTDNMTAQKEGEENVGRWKCIMKQPYFSVLKHAKTGMIRHVGVHEPDWPGWFTYHGDECIYKEVRAGGTRRLKRSSVN